VGFEPELLVLDEPAAGLDPLARFEFLQLLLDLIQNPTRNTAWYLFPRNVFLFWFGALFIGIWAIVLLVVLNHWLMASLLCNLFLVSCAAMMAREQLTFAFVACLPNHQLALRRHLLLVGIAANVLLVLPGLVFYRIPWQVKLDTAEAMFCVGLLLYLVLSRMVLSLANLAWWHLTFLGLLLMPQILHWDTSPRTPFVIALNLPLRLARLHAVGSAASPRRHANRCGPCPSHGAWNPALRSGLFRGAVVALGDAYRGDDRARHNHDRVHGPDCRSDGRDSCQQSRRRAGSPVAVVRHGLGAVSAASLPALQQGKPGSTLA
jgi:hypothetical protein